MATINEEGIEDFFTNCVTTIAYDEDRQTYIW